MMKKKYSDDPDKGNFDKNFKMKKIECTNLFLEETSSFFLFFRLFKFPSEIQEKFLLEKT